MESNILKESDTCFNYFGYKVYKNGQIISPKGNELKAYDITHPGSHVTLRVDGKIIKLNKAKLIYTLFSGCKTNITTKYFICYKDGDETNAEYENLYLTPKKDVLKRNSGKSKFSEKEKEKIKKDYEIHHISLRLLARKYECSLLTIQKVLAKM